MLPMLVTDIMRPLNIWSSQNVDVILTSCHMRVDVNELWGSQYRRTMGFFVCDLYRDHFDPAASGTGFDPMGTILRSLGGSELAEKCCRKKSKELMKPCAPRNLPTRIVELVEVWGILHARFPLSAARWLFKTRVLKIAIRFGVYGARCLFGLDPL